MSQRKSEVLSIAALLHIVGKVWTGRKDEAQGEKVRAVGRENDAIESLLYAYVCRDERYHDDWQGKATPSTDWKEAKSVLHDTDSFTYKTRSLGEVAQAFAISLYWLIIRRLDY